MKNVLPKIALGFLLLMPLLGRAQEIRISGRVVDAKTKEPIPFASISMRAAGAGALTNESGYFQLLGPTKLRSDSLVFMTMGYCRYAVPVKPGQLENLHVELNPGCMAGISITHCPVRANATTGKPASTASGEVITGLPGTQYAFFIENDKRKQTRPMRSVSFYLGENGLPMAPFRIRIYQAAGNSHSPAADLLTERVVLTPAQSGQWFTSDLSRYGVAVPKEGCFVALEFVNPADNSPQPTAENYTPSGQVMRPAFDFKNSIMWQYSPEKGWALSPQSGSSRRYNAMVKIEVEAAE